MWRRWSVTIGGIALMLIAIIGFEWHVRSTDHGGTRVRVWQPNAFLPAGTVVQASMVRSVEVPEQTMAEDAVLRIEDMIGQFVAVPMAPNEAVVGWKLSRLRIPQSEERYVSFAAEEGQTMGIRAGDVVDVWVEMQEPLYGKSGVLFVLPVISALSVVSVRGADGAEWTATTDPAQFSPKWNTFVMTPDVYEAYVAAQKMGRIRLLKPMTSVDTSLAQGRVVPSFVPHRAQWVGSFQKGER